MLSSPWRHEPAPLADRSPRRRARDAGELAHRPLPDAEGRADPARCLERALALHQRELLPGHYKDWIEPVRRRLTHGLLRGARELAAALDAAGDATGALVARRRAVEVDPLEKDAHRELMAA